MFPIPVCNGKSGHERWQCIVLLVSMNPVINPMQHVQINSPPYSLCPAQTPCEIQKIIDSPNCCKSVKYRANTKHVLPAQASCTN